VRSIAEPRGQWPFYSTHRAADRGSFGYFSYIRALGSARRKKVRVAQVPANPSPYLGSAARLQCSKHRGVWRRAMPARSAGPTRFCIDRGGPPQISFREGVTYNPANSDAFNRPRVLPWESCKGGCAGHQWSAAWKFDFTDPRPGEGDVAIRKFAVTATSIEPSVTRNTFAGDGADVVGQQGSFTARSRVASPLAYKWKEDRGGG